MTATDSSQERILTYLQENASESLANKINNGIPITKENIQLLNKKDLSTFMTYATEEAKKLATNGARYTCVDDSTVVGWAIHYFEEDSIEGKLYNLDGTEYKPVTKTTPKATNRQKSFTAPTTAKLEPPKPQQEQRSLFDMLEPTTVEPVENNASMDTTPIIEPTIEPTLDTTHIDADTGEVLEDIPVADTIQPAPNTEPIPEQIHSIETIPPTQQTPTFDRETIVYLTTLLDDKIDIA